ncbi:hypothetical protein MPSEU_000188700 [Mayamaea pseudoterrestris]|nr:hypothetical protein MPSEU_000188700 [Mayamaea pseudoterrestris]
MPTQPASTGNGSNQRRKACRSFCASRFFCDMEAPAVISWLIVLVGLGVGAIILSLRIPDEKVQQTTRFNEIADEAFLKFDAALGEYKVSGLWLHQACHLDRMSFEEFREVYEYITWTGLDFEAVSCAVHVVGSAQRAKYENQTRTYLAKHYPNFPYKGFTGYNLNHSTGELQLGVIPVDSNRNESHFVAHFVEPLDKNYPWNLEAVDFDMNTSQYSKCVNESLETGALAVTERLKLLPPPTDPNEPYEYCLTMAQPGLHDGVGGYEKNVAVLVIRFMSLLQKAYQEFAMDDETVIYVYDSTKSVVEAEGEPAFLGGATLGIQQQLTFPKEVNYSSLPAMPIIQRKDKALDLAARQWTIVAVAYVGTYKPDYFLAIFGAFMIILASTCAAMWIFSRSKARAEKAAILLDSAKRAAQAERDLNDFIAHEVRNPLSAAISANSFVSIAVNEAEPLVSDETRQSTREDVIVIGNSLQYINDLLRSMLDFHCALSNQIKIQSKHVDIRNDVFNPVASMLYNRGCVFDVIIECPDDLVIMSDPLRLKQIILNLAVNATKFVVKGFVRLKAHVDDKAVYLCVEDSGPGIPVEKRGNLFSKFQTSLDSSSQGTGIGLSLCKHLVELLKGEIYLDETYDSGIADSSGARFVVALAGPSNTPWELHRAMTETNFVDVKNTKITADTDDMDTSDSCSLPEADDSLPAVVSVLFVDDDFILRKLFVRSVRRCRPDWIVCEAASGEAAIQLIEDKTDKHQPFNLIFLDQYMASTQKQLLGTETARLLRAKGNESVICGLSANDIAPQFMDAGADCFMMKPLPCETKELATALRRILASRRIRAIGAADDQV